MIDLTPAVAMLALGYALLVAFGLLVAWAYAVE